MPLWHIGIDEVGRGPWAGPVVACACALPDGYTIDGLRDSKRLSARQRERLRDMLRGLGSAGNIHYALSMRDAEVIDHVGIREANRLSMQDALSACIASLPRGDSIASIRIDGNDHYMFPEISIEDR